MQSSLILRVLLVCNGIIAAPISSLADLTNLESLLKQDSNVPTHLLNYAPAPQDYNSEARQHPSHAPNPSFAPHPVPQHPSGISQSSIVNTSEPIPSSPTSDDVNPESGSAGSGGGVPSFFASSVAGLVGGTTAFGTGLGSNVLSGGHVGNPIVDGAGTIANAGVGVAGLAAGIPKPTIS
ncbi:hypothetical protein PGT21_010704 [Puccinia graminis f. sp. tritici]|uniref:Uncharacterized protein n=2 Tax=Puccinia graminis f. sp. tritici TaxID=56615 RepID=E3L8B8_PUCGT|nr:uncharacterized protein PGTG_18572 [Puccinia graminis f. sp. tritici CRL 75-36-700-3]EFP92793.2 hypothetical protein PGTG_18572 [Puccinia graminis f. sp. tritici CRL 75-36-700-3]KAA1101197.1 hypothetical protein PGT21_010704 [Puccinia graminis f. sp. tritici]